MLEIIFLNDVSGVILPEISVQYATKNPLEYWVLDTVTASTF
jgi:hypothetical protein